MAPYLIRRYFITVFFICLLVWNTRLSAAFNYINLFTFCFIGASFALASFFIFPLFLANPLPASYVSFALYPVLYLLPLRTGYHSSIIQKCYFNLGNLGAGWNAIRLNMPRPYYLSPWSVTLQTCICTPG